MIEVFKHLLTYDRHCRTTSVAVTDQLVTIKPKDGTRGLQTNSFYYRVIRTWNNLPRIVVNECTINSFECRLDKAWNNIPPRYFFDYIKCRSNTVKPSNTGWWKVSAIQRCPLFRVYKKNAIHTKKPFLEDNGIFAQFLDFM